MPHPQGPLAAFIDSLLLGLFVLLMLWFLGHVQLEARVEGAREAMSVIEKKQCGWRDLFEPMPRKKT